MNQLNQFVGWLLVAALVNFRQITASYLSIFYALVKFRKTNDCDAREFSRTVSLTLAVLRAQNFKCYPCEKPINDIF